MAEGYDVQDRLIALLGHPVLGWKIGLAARDAYRRARLQRPLFGRILAPRCYKNGDELPIRRDLEITIELEIALVLGEDVDANTAIVPGLIHSAHLGFEIVSSRFPERQNVSMAAAVADNAVSHAVVLGDAVDLRHFAEIAAHASVTVDGRRVADALQGEELPDPLSGLGHLAAHLRERGQALKRGDIIFTGTLTKPFDIAAPCELIGSAPAPMVHCRLRPEA